VGLPLPPPIYSGCPWILLIIIMVKSPFSELSALAKGSGVAYLVVTVFDVFLRMLTFGFVSPSGICAILFTIARHHHGPLQRLDIAFITLAMLDTFARPCIAAPIAWAISSIRYRRWFRSFDANWEPKRRDESSGFTKILGILDRALQLDLFASILEPDEHNRDDPRLRRQYALNRFHDR
jgi:hypothetical protein